MDELKPCPRCHEPQKLRLSISHGGYYKQMRCKVCGWAARPAIGFLATPLDAIEIWNSYRRADDGKRQCEEDEKSI